MGRINLDVTEFNFNAKNTTEYALTLLVGFDSIYMTITDVENRVLVLRSFHFDHHKSLAISDTIDAVLLEEPLLKRIYRRTRIAVNTMHFTLVPNKFFDTQQKSLYFKNTNVVDSGENDFLFDKVENAQAVLVYPFSKNLYNKLIHNFPAAEINNSLTAQIDYCLMEKKIFDADRFAFINFRDGYLQLFFIENAQFIFCNNFKFNSPQDVVYYTLLIYEQFKLNPSVIPLYVSGSVTEDSDIYKYLFRYIAHIHFLSKPKQLHLGNQFTGIPPFFYLDIFCSTLVKN